jgi:hypothetical protein
MSEMSSLFSVGDKVRVLSVDKSEAHRAIISLYNGNGTYDVLYSAPVTVQYNQQIDEDSAITSDRISALLEFEYENASTIALRTASSWKDCGNSLFALKDYLAASECYKKGIERLTTFENCYTSVNDANNMLTTGRAVIVTFPGSLDCSTGIISDASADGYDVMFGDETLEEELGIPTSRLLLLACTSSRRIVQGKESGGSAMEEPLSAAEVCLLQRSCYMNLARCTLKRRQKGWAIKYCSIALAISKHVVQLSSSSNGSRNELASTGKEGKVVESANSKLLVDCLYFRGKALLAACRPKFAAMVSI